MSSSPVRVVVNGAAGRMGARVCALAHVDAAFALVGALEARGSAAIGRPACEPSARGEAPKIGEAPSSADVVIDFSSEAGALESVALARRLGAALLVGSTGLSHGAGAKLREAAGAMAVLLAPNTSLGVAVVADLVRRAAAALNSFDASIVEAHHSAKKDAPSGTALRLADAARSGGATVGPDRIVSVRGGDVVGEHTVRFAGAGEYVELTHRATSRDVFAAGALRAAKWLRGRGAGWWTMEDVLGLG